MYLYIIIPKFRYTYRLYKQFTTDTQSISIAKIFLFYIIHQAFVLNLDQKKGYASSILYNYLNAAVALLYV